MLILNAMFGRKKGGIEQAFVDYTIALSLNDCQEVVALAHKNAAIIAYLPKNIRLLLDSNFGSWDIFAIWRLRKLIEELKPDVIITHGNRAAILLSKAAQNVPVICVCHNYTAKAVGDYYLSITKHLANTMIAKHGVLPEKIFHLPNMIELSEHKHQEKNNQPLVIGAMGRFVAKKGFKVLLQALAILKSRGLNFICLLAGDGEEVHALRELTTTLNLKQDVQFIGWVEDKEKFYPKLDIFCLPSLDEPFGIVLLEAMSYGLPIISTNTIGPLEIFSNQTFLATKGDEQDLAAKLTLLLQDKDLRHQLGSENYQKVQAYSMQKVGKTLTTILEQISTDNQGNKKCSYHPV